LDIPLFNHPVDQLADLLTGEINVSSPIRRVALKKYLSAYYGPDRSILVEVDGEIKAADQILVCDLSNDSEGDWNIPDEFKSSPDDCKGKVAIDPALGRLMLPNKAAGKIYVTYYYGFSADMGSGLYKRDLYQAPADAGMYLIGADATYKTLSEAVAAWKSKKANAVFEFINNDSYVEASLDIQIPAGVEIIIRSAQEARATITAAGETSKLNISGEEGSTLVLDGLILDRNLPLTINKQLTVSQEVAAKSSLGSLTVQNCALLPPSETEANSIVVDGNDFVKVTLNKSITGPVYMKTSQGTLTLKDSVVDCGSIESSGAKHIAVDCIEASVENTTIFGKSNFETLNYASNVIFTDTVKVKRRQQGCVRFSYIAHRYDPDLMIASKMPRCYRCQPESATSKIAPRFTSKRYGNPGYAQLHRQAVKEISEGADNGSEIGAFNQIYQAHRINNLRATFSEYLPFGLEAGIILVT
jgi:hypothetical protein